MSELMAIAAAALRSDQTRMDQISLNAANVSTTGYRRGIVVSSSFAHSMETAEATTSSSANHSGEEPASASLLPALSSAVDQTQAALTVTNRPLDVAIDGNAYLVLSDGEKTYLTRSGAFKVDANGYLLGPRSLRVQGTQGDIHVSSQEGLSIASDGRMTSNGQQIATLKMLSPGKGAILTSTDGVVLSSNSDEYVDAAPGTATVRSGSLEASNASGVEDMLQLVETVRHFEGMVRLIQGYDDILGRAIQKLGDI